MVLALFSCPGCVSDTELGPQSRPSPPPPAESQAHRQGTEAVIGDWQEVTRVRPRFFWLLFGHCWEREKG